MLHFFDFATSSFSGEPSATLFVDDRVHATETGKRLNELVEQPVAQHMRVLETDPRADLTDHGSWPGLRFEVRNGTAFEPEAVAL